MTIRNERCSDTVICFVYMKDAFGKNQLLTKLDTVAGVYNGVLYNDERL